MTSLDCTEALYAKLNTRRGWLPREVFYPAGAVGETVLEVRWDGPLVVKLFSFHSRDRRGSRQI
jgi:hypothetical protein